MSIEVILAGGERFIQDGVTAIRSPIGEPLPAEPQYIRVTQKQLTALYGGEYTEKTLDGGELCEVGAKHSRSEDGEFVGKEPYYTIRPPQGASGIPKEDVLAKNIAATLCDKMKQYIEGGGLVGEKKKKRGGVKARLNF